jgi:hypothetical protein
MATLVFSALGTALGGPLGGAIGALAGRQLDGALFGPAPRNGPRLRELEVSLSSYGTAIPRLHGRMRVAGAIIWASELQEHSELRGTGKGTPALTTYGYTANLAVALSSRPIQGLGRIWADGKLLRGVAGDLKAGGQLRIHHGHDDQPPDPLIAASEGEQRCPAFRGIAYVVFEALDLSDFGNRIPALTFEVIADHTVRLHDILGESLPGVTVPHEPDVLAGFAVEDTLGASLAALIPALPIALDGAGDTVVARSADDPAAVAVPLGEAAISVEDDAFGGAAGHSRRRTAGEPQPPPVLRYGDIDRDFLPGTQHAGGRAGPGQPDVVELPAALDGATARMLVDRMAQRRDRARERVAWRTTTLDSAVAPGVLVRLPDRAGTWQVDSWEWREAGVELELVRVPARAAVPPAPALPPPPFPAPLDALPAATRLVVCELPWDAVAGAPDRPRLAAAVSAAGPHWSGAALYTDAGDGQLRPSGSASRTRAVIGTTRDVLGAASPLLIDRGNSVTVNLAAADLALTGASLADLAGGANLALVGEELIQFARAEPLGEGGWRLSGLLRGRGGTEHGVPGHRAGEPFALLDDRLTILDALATRDATLVALGRGDEAAVAAAVHLTDIALRPLAPVHARADPSPNEGTSLAWTRRARGGWPWRDGVDMPLAEESERYVVSYADDAALLRTWTVAEPRLTLSAAELAMLRRLAPAGRFAVRQQGTHAVSDPLPLALPADHQGATHA